MASYHLSVKTVKRSVGRSATAAAAYRAAERITCEREGIVHDYTRKQGVVESFILAPTDTPDWVQDRAVLWNGAEAAERRLNAVVAREWELALPADLSDAARADLARGFAEALVARYGIAADVAIHAPHREGDQRNHHAHILTTTRMLGANGFGAKTRILDAASTGGAEIADMRALWAEMQNRALERAGAEARVDHRSLEDQRDAALEQGDDLAAAALDRAPEIKLGPATSAIERRAMAEAQRDGVNYAPVTERGAQNHQIRQARDVLAELRARAERAREAYVQARALDASRIGAAVEAARAMFANTPLNDAFASGFEAAMQARDDARAQALEEERQRQFEAERDRFVEDTARAWQDSREMSDHEAAKARQAELVDEVERFSGRHAIAFDDLARSINDRADDIRDERAKTREAERELELARAKERERSRDSGWEL